MANFNSYVTNYQWLLSGQFINLRQFISHHADFAQKMYPFAYHIHMYYGSIIGLMVRYWYSMELLVLHTSTGHPMKLLDININQVNC